jgi:hypothetical protein
MNFDNAATRPHLILEKALEANKETNCHSVWMQLLQASDEEDLLSKLGGAMQLPGETARLVATHHPAQVKSIARWQKPIMNGFKSMHLGGTWQTFSAHIDHAVVSQVGLIGELLHTSVPFPVLKEDDIGRVIDKLSAAMATVKDENNINIALKRHVVCELHALIQALRDYRVSGAVPVLRQVEAMQFHSAIDSEYKSFLTSTEVGQHVLDGLNAAAALLTIVSGGYAFAWARLTDRLSAAHASGTRFKSRNASNNHDRMPISSVYGRF